MGICDWGYGLELKIGIGNPQSQIQIINPLYQFQIASNNANSKSQSTSPISNPNPTPQSLILIPDPKSQSVMSIPNANPWSQSQSPIFIYNPFVTLWLLYNVPNMHFVRITHSFSTNPCIWHKIDDTNNGRLNKIWSSIFTLLPSSASNSVPTSLSWSLFLIFPRPSTQPTTQPPTHSGKCRI